MRFNLLQSILQFLEKNKKNREVPIACGYIFYSNMNVAKRKKFNEGKILIQMIDFCLYKQR